MTGKLKNQLDLGFGQPKGFLSAKVQDDCQAKKTKPSLNFGQSK